MRFIIIRQETGMEMMHIGLEFVEEKYFTDSASAWKFLMCMRDLMESLNIDLKSSGVNDVEEEGELRFYVWFELEMEGE